MYGGFTPAGGLFATLTPPGMLGWEVPAESGIGVMVATIFTTVVWACGVGV